MASYDVAPLHLTAPMARGPNDPDYEYPERSRPSPTPPPARSDPHSLMYDNFHPDAGAGVSSSPQHGMSSVPRWEAGAYTRPLFGST